MTDLTRAEYPSVLANLQPSQAVQVLSDRLKHINRINLEVADWFQERRRVEEQYAQGLRRLAQFRVPNSQTELGVFQMPWHRVTDAVETIAQSHHAFAERLEQDIENPLRVFQQRQDAASLHTMSNNLAGQAKELEEAKDKSEKLNKKGGKASTQKVGAVSSKLESVSQQWESQAPYIFETLQALDESRINQLRDLLTQYQTLESDQAQRNQDTAVETLAQMIEISTETEIHGFVENAKSGRPTLTPRTTTRQNTGLSAQDPTAASRPTSSQQGPPTLGGRSTLTPSTSSQNQTQGPTQRRAEDESREQPATTSEPEPKSRLRRLGTILGRRRQSVHGGVASPQKGGSGFGRLGGGSSQARGVSPRPSTGNLRENSKLTSLQEQPDQQDSIEPVGQSSQPTGSSHDGTNGINLGETAPGQSLLDSPVPAPQPSAVNGTHDAGVAGVPPPPGPPPSQQAQPTSPVKDSEGFSQPGPMNDPISEAQREAAGEDADQMFKLNIQNKPIEEEDPEAKQAAISSVSNTLRMGPATRRSGTVRGRRDVRNTIYVPSPTASEAQPEATIASIPGSPSPVTAASRPAAVAALASEASIATSDSQSVRSGTSLNSLARMKHPEMTEPGLNASIIETVSAVFEDGIVTTASISGEIAFVNNGGEAFDAKSRETIKIENFPSLERIGPNRIFVQNVPEQPEQFNLDLSHISKTSTAFSYKVFAEEAGAASLGRHAPLLLKPAWKPQGDKLGLLLQYQLNPSAEFTGPVTLHNVVFVATYNGKASGAQTKPTGTHLKEKHIVYWRLGDITLTSDMQKIVCRIIGADGAEPTPGHVEARWEYVSSADEAVGSGISISRLDETKGKGKEVVADDDPFADETTSVGDQAWVQVPLARKLVSGKYESK